MSQSIGKIVGYLAIPFVAFWAVDFLVHVLFDAVRLYRIPAFYGPGHLIEKWAGYGAAAYVVYLLLIGKSNQGPGIGKASTTSKTGRQVKASTYTFETHTPSVPRINLVNPFRGVLILGGAGAGKSKSLIEPIIRQTIERGYAGLLYDFKFPTLAQVASHARQQRRRGEDRPGLAFYFVNFEDLTCSHRINPLDPATMPTQSHADEYARAILYNLKPDAIKKGDFWTDSAHSYLTALIWFLREEYPPYCTLPHVMALAFQPTADVVALLSTNPETRGTIASLRESVQRKAEGQTAGVVSTLQTALRRINTKEIVWVLSGSDFTLNLNDPQAPKFVTLGNSPTLSSTFAPVIALLATVAIKQMNQPGKVPSAIILDEAPTLYIPNFDQLPATGRSNQIATIYGAQDISQMEDMYGRSKKDALLANLNNQFYGRVGHRETAQYIADLWGREYVQQRTEGQNESSRDFETTQSRSTSHSYTERSRVRIQDVLELNTGEFYGQLVDSDFSSFKAQIRVQETGPIPELVPFMTATSQEVKRNFMRIQAEIETVVLGQQRGADVTTAKRTKRTETEPPATVEPHRRTGSEVNSQTQAGQNGQALPNESLDF